MSEANVNIGQIESMDNVVITSSKEFSPEQNANDVMNKSSDSGHAKGHLDMDFNLPTEATDKNSDPLEDEEPKVLMTIEANIAANTNGKVETKEADSGQPEAQRGKPTSPDFVETVQISNADSSIEISSKEMFLHSIRSLNSKDSIEEESFEVVEVIGMPCNSKNFSTGSDENPLADANDDNNDDLIAILEGDADSTTIKNSDEADGETIELFEVIETEDQDEKKLDAEEEKKIALEQMRNIPTKKRGRQPALTKQDGGALISSLVSDWSDNEKDPEPSRQLLPIAPAGSSKTSLSLSKHISAPVKKVSPASEKKIVVVKKKAQRPMQEPQKTAPTVTSMKPARIIKKKIIWDPDAPETQFSYASLIKSSTTPRKSKVSTTSTSVEEKDKSEPNAIAPSDKLKSPATDTVTKSKTDVSTTDKPAASVVTKPKPTVATKPKQAVVAKAKPAVASSPKPTVTTKPKASQVTSAKTKKPAIPTPMSASMQPKVRILKRSTPSPNSAVQNKRKRVSEIDRLLNDEGAANMLNKLDSEKPSQKDSRGRKPPTPVTTQTDATPKKQASTKKRAARGSASKGWDYVYNQQNVDSLIIRRRSNSSYSSTTSPRRMSLEAKPVRVLKGKSKSFEFVKPDTKKTGKRSAGNVSDTMIKDIKKSQLESGRKSNRTPVPTEPKETLAKAVKAAEISSSHDEKNSSEVSMKKHDSVVQLIVKPKSEFKNCFTVQLMNEVVRHLNILQADNACKVVVITSAGSSFCQGIDFSAMIQGNVDKRKSSTQEIAASITSFLKALINFPKPLVAGVVGPCTNLGLTMLPAFDVVIASDKSTFETTYAKIGQIPEGNCLISSTNNMRHSFKVKLFWLCDKLTSTEAALSGLVTSLTAPSKVVEDAIQHAKRLAALSQQALIALKTQRPETKKLTLTLDVEQKILIHQWQTPECQEKFKQYIAKESW